MFEHIILIRCCVAVNLQEHQLLELLVFRLLVADEPGEDLNIFAVLMNSLVMFSFGKW